MPKVIVEYDLPEEDAELKLALYAGRLATALDALREHLRRRRKYDDLSEDVLAEVERAESVLYDYDVEDLLG